MQFVLKLKNENLWLIKIPWYLTYVLHFIDLIKSSGRNGEKKYNRIHYT